MTIKCICVDDEPLARQGISLSLAPHKEFELVGEFESVESALDNCTDDIDVMFVDIEMPRKNGFDLVEAWPHDLPIVIFVTAYDQYAVRAFEKNALDYLLKPIDEDRFAVTIERVKSALKSGRRFDENKELMNKLSLLRKKLYSNDTAISLKTDDGYFRVKLGKVLFIESAGDHVCFHLEDRQILTRSTLKKYHAELAESGFLKIHKSFLVNERHVKSLKKANFGDYEVVLSNDKELRLSRRHKEVAKRLLDRQ